MKRIFTLLASTIGLAAVVYGGVPTAISAVPEPSSIALVAVGAAGLVVGIIRKNRQK